MELPNIIILDSMMGISNFIINFRKPNKSFGWQITARKEGELFLAWNFFKET